MNAAVTKCHAERFPFIANVYQSMYFPNMVTINNTFLMTIMSVYVTILSVLFTDEKTAIKSNGLAGPHRL